MKYKIVKKAWGIDWSRIDEGDYHSGNIDSVYAETRGKAKSLLLSDISDYKLRWSSDDITYLNAPVVRYSHDDKYEYEGAALTLSEIKRKKRDEERLNEFDNIINDPKITHCYIYKNGYYYADNHCGYVSSQSRAGVYTKEDAVSSGKSCEDLHINPINTKEHNEMISAEIEKLKSRLIKEAE